MRAPTLFFTSLVSLGSLAACRRGAPDAPAPRFLVGVSPSAEFTAIGASFYASQDLAYRDRACLGLRLRDGREPASLEAGRVEAFIVGGAVLGHADRRAEGTYQAAVRAVLPAGAAVSASIAGSPGVPAHTFHTPAHVPRPVRMTAPSRGFALTRDQPLTVRWEGGDSSDVMIVVQVTRGAEARGEGWMLTCVVPRAEGAFTIPAAAMASRYIPSGADTVTVVATADDRVREGDYAVDVTPVGRDDDLVSGSVR